jgi:galactan endo-1,6-beta-galactosidase
VTDPSADLSRFAQATGGTDGVVTRWSTVPGGTDRYPARSEMMTSGKAVRVPFAAGSVQTLQIDGVTA